MRQEQISLLEDDLLNGRAFEVVAKANFEVGNIADGFEFSWQALGYYETLKDHRWQAGLYNLIGKQNISITVSMGIACTTADSEKRVDLLLEQASQAWSLAKQNRGIQVVTLNPANIETVD